MVLLRITLYIWFVSGYVLRALPSVTKEINLRFTLLSAVPQTLGLP